MITVPCPWCGPRNSEDLRYVGESRPRPQPDAASEDEWRNYLYFRNNPAGWTTETWYCRAGCRRYFVVERHTVTNEIRTSRRPRRQIELGQIELGQIELGQIESGQIESGQIESGQIELGQIEMENS